MIRIAVRCVGSDLDFSMVVLALPAEEIHLQRSRVVTREAQSDKAEHNQGLTFLSSLCS